MKKNENILDEGPFFHGTKAALEIGDLLNAQNLSNFQGKNPMMSILRHHWMLLSGVLN